jgi:CDGSH-type Zn-finger protein
MSKTKLTINKKTVLSKLKVILKYWIEGKVYGLGRTALGLCRCGLSSNKPFVMVHTVISFERSSADLPPMKTN